MTTATVGPETEPDESLPDEPLEAAPVAAMYVWIPAARLPVLTAMESAGIGVVDEPDGATYAVVSTRLARHRIGEYTAQATEAGLSVVILVHPGGEAIAVDALRSGGHLAIAEGDAAALRSLYGTNEPNDERTNSFLDAYEARLGRTQAAAKTNVAMFDPTSGLPASGALSARLTTATYDPDQSLRMVAINVAGLGDSLRMRLGAEAHVLLHRRIAMGIRLLCQPLGELFDNGGGTFVLLAPRLSIEAAERLGRSLAEVVGGYSPDGHAPLTVAVGHAGPECSSDLSTLRELAGRAESAACQEDHSAVLGAGELVGPLATATELEVTLRLAELAGERVDGVPRQEIAAVASEIAIRLGFEGRERVLVRFCAEVADIGAALSTDPAAYGELGARVLDATAGPAVATILRSIGEYWDGTGQPGELQGPQIPVAARIIAVAEALVAAKFKVDDVESWSGTRYDPTVVAAATDVARQR